MLEKLKILFGLIWLALLIVQSFLANLYLQSLIPLSFCVLLFVMGIFEYKKEQDEFLAYWYFISAGVSLLVALLIYFGIF